MSSGDKSLNDKSPPPNENSIRNLDLLSLMRDHGRSPLQSPEKDRKEENLSSGLRSAEEARKSIGDRRDEWDYLNLRINLATNSGERNKALELRQEQFPDTLKYLQAARNAMSAAQASEIPERQVIIPQSTMQCHQISRDLSYGAWHLPSPAQAELSEKLRSLETPSGKVKGDYLAGQLTDQLFGKLNPDQLKQCQKQLGEFRKAHGDDEPSLGTLAKAIRLAKDWQGPGNEAFARMEAILSPPRAESDHVEIVRNHGASAEFARTVENATEKIPDKLLALLKKSGYEVVTTDKTSSEIGTITMWLNGRPRGWPKGSSWDSPEGMTNGKEIIVSEKREANGQWYDNNRANGVLRHEMGHAVNAVLAPWTRSSFSNTSAFRAAYDKDVANMSAADKAKATYFLQSGDAGRDETFADCFANIAGGPSNESDSAYLSRVFPEVHKVIRAKLEEYKK